VSTTALESLEALEALEPFGRSLEEVLGTPIRSTPSIGLGERLLTISWSGPESDIHIQIDTGDTATATDAAKTLARALIAAILRESLQ
jgi:hypothetical protein